MVNTLISLADAYGDKRDTAVEIFNIPAKDLAEVADVKVLEVPKILDKLADRNWITIDKQKNVIRLLDMKNLRHLSKLG